MSTGGSVGSKEPMADGGKLSLRGKGRYILLPSNKLHYNQEVPFGDNMICGEWDLVAVAYAVGETTGKMWVQSDVSSIQLI